ncbi:MAG: hypothetical protein GYA74_02880 [Acidobacteria bacterium]|jgi:hypothetical protein|nr:hypothetical protein [Acidobacteriota bacterium]MDD8027926.1 hypothetical protein [Acidobacteriota bacterium]MDW3226229.1 hypothetical protein [Acidobacteriota bacterium]NMD10095.1 hypothetical protein [Acidobacteriota bacterium]
MTPRCSHGRFPGLVPLLAVLVFFVPACGKKTPAGKDEAKGISDLVSKASAGRAEIDFQKGQLTVKTPGGSAVLTSGGGSWPADLPEDLAPFRAGSIRNSTNSQSPEGTTWTVTFAGAGAEDVAAYIEDLKGDGWSLIMESEVPQGAFTRLERENMVIQLTFMSGDGALIMNILRRRGD